jgi:hypothetical protein
MSQKEVGLAPASRARKSTPRFIFHQFVLRLCGHLDGAEERAAVQQSEPGHDHSELCKMRIKLRLSGG